MKNEKEPVLKGGCSCGEVTYQIDRPLMRARSCHCSQCRKVFSSACSAYAEVQPGSFRWLSGEHQLTQFRTKGKWGLAFCKCCGTTLCGICGEDVHGVTLGSVDGDPKVKIEMHIFVDSKAPWDEIGGNAPQYNEHPE